MSKAVPSDTMLSSFHVHAARALLGWSRGGLARRAGVASQSVQRIEEGTLFSLDSLEATQGVLESAGVEFSVCENGGSVRLVGKPSAPRHL